MIVGMASELAFLEARRLAPSEYTLLLAKDIGFLEETVYKLLIEQVITVKRMLTSFIKKLKADS